MLVVDPPDGRGRLAHRAAGPIVSRLAIAPKPGFSHASGQARFPTASVLAIR